MTAAPIGGCASAVRGMFLRLIAALAFVLFAGVASAADRHTCQVIQALMEATDRGLTRTAAGEADRSPASGIATYAGQALEFAASFSTRDPLPEEVITALTAMATAASSVFSIADAAPALLEHGLVIHEAMPQICPGAEVPDLTRHAG